MKKALDEIEDPAEKEVLGDSKSLPLPVISSSQHQCSGYYDCWWEEMKAQKVTDLPTTPQLGNRKAGSSLTPQP